MISLLDDLSRINHCYLVRIDDGRQPGAFKCQVSRIPFALLPVSHKHYSAVPASDQFVDGILHKSFALCVQSGSGFVQK